MPHPSRALSAEAVRKLSERFRMAARARISSIFLALRGDRARNLERGTAQSFHTWGNRGGCFPPEMNVNMPTRFGVVANPRRLAVDQSSDRCRRKAGR